MCVSHEHFNGFRAWQIIELYSFVDGRKISNSKTDISEMKKWKLKMEWHQAQPSRTFYIELH